MNHFASRRVSGLSWLVPTAIAALIALIAALLVAPPAGAQTAATDATDSLQLSSDKSAWVPAPTPEILSWSSPFQNMSPGDTSRQEYYIRNNGDVAVRVGVTLMVSGLDPYSYLRGRSTITQDAASVDEITSKGDFYLIGDDALGTAGLSGSQSESSNTEVSSAVLQPGSIARVVNTFTVPAEIGSLPSEMQHRFMNQTTQAYLVPRASFSGVLSIRQAAPGPIVAGVPTEFVVAGAPAGVVAGGTFVVTDDDGNEVHTGTIGPDGSGAFTHTFDQHGDRTLTVTFVPENGQSPVGPATITIHVLPENCAPATGGGSSSGSTGSPGAGSLGPASGSNGSVTPDCQSGGGTGPGSSTGSLSGVGGIIGAGLGLLLVAGIGYGIWYLAHALGVPGVGPAPGQQQRVDTEGRAYSGVPAASGLAAAASAPSGGAGTDPVGHSAQYMVRAVDSIAAAFGIPGAGSTGAVIESQYSAPEQDDRSWFARIVDSVRGFFG